VVAKEGLLGQEMCHFFEAKGISFVGSTHQEADILSRDALTSFFDQEEPTHIVNCAAYVNVDEAEGKGKELAYALNGRGAKNLTLLAKEKGARLIHIGTDYVFDGKKEEDYTETDLTNPINVYGKSKLEGEIEVLRYSKGLSLRTASIYGPWKKGLISGILEGLKTKEEMGHIVDQISAPTYTKDIAEAVFAIRDQAGIFHFANKGYISRYGLLMHLWKLAKELGREVICQKIRPVTQKEANRPAIRPERSVLATHKIEPFLSHPIRTWEEALREYVETLC